jgi:hypothetical protein
MFGTSPDIRIQSHDSSKAYASPILPHQQVWSYLLWTHDTKFGFLLTPHPRWTYKRARGENNPRRSVPKNPEGGLHCTLHRRAAAYRSESQRPNFLPFSVCLQYFHIVSNSNPEALAPFLIP